MNAANTGAQSHPITDAMLPDHIAVLAKTGAGKSYATQGIVERLLDRNARTCVIDPTGRYWGLRSDANGKKAGFPIVVFGGKHADVPLQATHGAAIAEIVATTNTPAILDTRLMTVADRSRMFSDFAETLLAKNEGPLHLVIDEAHLFAPKGKVLNFEAGRLIAATNNLVSLGRGSGLRVIMISQRASKLHNDCLTQAETLVVLRMTHPADRQAVSDWIKDCGDPAHEREIISSLKRLPTGTGYVWSPGLDVLEKVTFPRIRTYDSGAPPSKSDRIEPTLATIDLPAILARLGKVAEDVKANDPKELRLKVAELERKLAAATKQGAGTSAPSQADLSAAQAEGYARGLAVGRAEGQADIASIQARVRALGERTGDIARVCEDAGRLATELGEALGEIASFAPPPPVLPPAGRPTASSVAPKPKAEPRPAAPSMAAEAGDGFNGVERRILGALADLNIAGFDTPSRSHVAIFAGYLHERSTGFVKALGTLHTRNVVEYADGARLRFAAGYTPYAFASDGPPATRGEIVARFVRALSSHADTRRTTPWFECLAERLDGGAKRDELAQMLGYQHVRSTGFVKVLGSLRSKGLVDYAPGERVVLASDIAAVIAATPEG
ncbi:MAG: DUF87 domain-containing protein [Alphaproteobacteria bacterium]|nr:DUF87 domain-containing protein [Alphaproteobacteria bacterium]